MKDKTVAALLAIFTGSLGLHKFYLGRPIMGLLYLLFCWTCIPSVVGFIEGILLLCMDEGEFYRKYNI